MKSQMVSIHSDLENEFVFNITNTGKMDGDHSDCAWIGLFPCSHMPDRHNWCNMDNSPVDYVNWDVYNGVPEPSNTDKRESCVEMYSDIGCRNNECRAKWNDIDCDLKHKKCVCKR